MKYLIFFKETFNKKSTVNYFFIIFSLFVIIDVSFMFYKYSGKILNDNYKNSYFLLELNTKNKINLIENYSNIDVYQKCILLSTFKGSAFRIPLSGFRTGHIYIFLLK